MDNFYIYTDSEGKMPQLSYEPWNSNSHRFYTRYLKDSPVECVPYPGQTETWDYKLGKYVPIDKIVKS